VRALVSAVLLAALEGCDKAVEQARPVALLSAPATAEIRDYDTVVVPPVADGQVSEPEPAPEPEPEPEELYDPYTYPDWNGYDLDCRDVGRMVRVTGDDPHRLDRDGDGWGCETYGS
jgi:hypothetical protein